MSRVFSREEFYELVWSKPMTHLAKEFALSDVALHKICRKHGIPNPPLGWWAKKAAGQRVRKTPLPKAQKGIADRITISGGELRGEAKTLLVVRERARVLASSSTANEPQASYPIVDRTIAKLRKAKPSPAGLVSIDEEGLVKCEVAPASIDRLATILNGIAAATALQGFRLCADRSSAHFANDQQSVAFSVTETVRRVKHELTVKEQSLEEKWRRKAERHRAAHDWHWEFTSRPKSPEWDYHCTGRFSFEFENLYVWGQSPRRAFRDAKVQRLENMASDIAVGLAVFAAAKAEQRLRREAKHRRQEEAQRLREDALRSKHVEERRASALDCILGELEQVDRMHRLIAMLRIDGGAPPACRVARFIEWSERQVVARETAVSAEGLRTRFEDQRLFGDDDDHGFRPPNY